MKVIFTPYVILCFTIYTSIAYTQSITPELLSIEVDVAQGNQIITIHTIQKGETLYSIAKFYKVPLQELMATNNIQSDQIVSLNSQIRIPLLNEYINKSGIKSDPNWIPVTYTIKKKETLYTIGKKYFAQNIEDLNKRNDINSFIIHENEKLIIGWWPTSTIKESSETLVTEPLITIDDKATYTREITASESSKILSIQEKAKQIAGSIKTENKTERPRLEPLSPLNSKNSVAQISKVYSPEQNDYIVIDSSRITHVPIDSTAILEDLRTRINRKGICLWMRNDPETKQLLAFHKTAKIGSKILVSYPLTNRTVEVEVIDNIKPNLYPDDVEIIVTKAVALELGARDSRIQIIMDYYQ